MKPVGFLQLISTRSLGWQIPTPFFKHADDSTFQQSLRGHGQEMAHMSGYSLIARSSLLMPESLAALC
jgi:hypothetical protein